MSGESMTQNYDPKNSPSKMNGLNCAASVSNFDSYVHTYFAKMTFGLSPVSSLLAITDYALNLHIRPSRLNEISQSALSMAENAFVDSFSYRRIGANEPGFESPFWQIWPWRFLICNYLTVKDHALRAVHVRGMKSHHMQMMHFFTKQWIDMISPTNYGLMNPEVMKRTYETGGINLLNGAEKSLLSWFSQIHPISPEKRNLPFKPGIDVAVTKGKVIFRNDLIELIQYLPMTSSVDEEPVLIIPSWIMKYYILDLSQNNSLVRWLVNQGRTVFMISWRNPDENDSALSISDYLQQGIFDSLTAISQIIPGTKVHACGYCLGGTLLSLAAAALARQNGNRRTDAIPGFSTISLLAAETDFSEPGEMGVLIDEAEVSLLEDIMAIRGFLTGKEMSGSFTFLHSRDLFWTQRLREFWLGENYHSSDLMSWNSDVTRMPAVMHSEYLRKCYLANEIAEGRFLVEGSPVSLLDINSPIFCVGTEKDHVAPWKSVYKIHNLSRTEVTFVLTSGGHNAGIISEPGHGKRHYSSKTTGQDYCWISPDEWLSRAKYEDGSWWPFWKEWLSSKSTGKKVKARTPLARRVLCDAPGEYVHMRFND